MQGRLSHSSTGQLNTQRDVGKENVLFNVTILGREICRCRDLLSLALGLGMRFRFKYRARAMHN